MLVPELRERQPVRADDDTSGVVQPTVVVAVDGRPASADALAWAADEAWCRGMKLRVVTAYADPEHPYAPKSVEHALAVQRTLRRQLSCNRPWVEEAEYVIRRGSVAALLAEALVPGDMLVVGEAADVRSMDPLLQPTCPVVVVPEATAAVVGSGDVPVPRM